MQAMAMIFRDQQFLQGIVLWVMLAILFGMVLSWGWAIRRLWSRLALLPAQPLVRRDETRWGAGTTLLVLLVYVLGTLMASKSYLLVTRGVRSMRPASGSVAPDRAESEKPGSEPQEA